MAGKSLLVFEAALGLNMSKQDQASLPRIRVSCAAFAEAHLQEPMNHCSLQGIHKTFNARCMQRGQMKTTAELKHGKAPESLLARAARAGSPCPPRRRCRPDELQLVKDGTVNVIDYTLKDASTLGLEGAHSLVFGSGLEEACLAHVGRWKSPCQLLRAVGPPPHWKPGQHALRHDTW